MLLITLGCMYLSELLFSFTLDIYSGVELLDNMLALVFVFWGTYVLFSTVAIPIYIFTNHVLGFSFFHILANIYYLFGDVILRGASLVAQLIKNLPTMCDTWVWSWVGKIPWRRIWYPTPIFLPGESPWTEEPGRLLSMVSQRVGHNGATKHSTALNTAIFSSLRVYGPRPPVMPETACGAEPHLHYVAFYTCITVIKCKS